MEQPRAHGPLRDREHRRDIRRRALLDLAQDERHPLIERQRVEGTGERLRESFPDIVIAAAEPLPGDSVMGLRSLDDGYVPPILDVSKLDRKILVSNAESVRAVRALLALEGIFAGVSCGAAVHVARKIAEEMDEGVIVTILADAGWKYLSADFWDAPDEELEESMESTLWW